MKYLFGGEFYYAKGGKNDFIAKAKDLDDLKTLALEKFMDEEIEWFHITNEDMEIICGTAWQAHDAKELKTGSGIALRYNRETKSYYWD